MSLNETLLPPWSPSCLFRASRASAARSMSTSLVRKKWGMGPSDVAKRFAIVLRIWVRGTSAYGAPAPAGTGDAGRGTGVGVAAVACKSRITTRPPGPDPVTACRSTPRSFAMRFARGEAFTRVASTTGDEGRGPGDGAGADTPFGDATRPSSPVPRPPSATTVSPGAAMIATTLPTGTVCPSATATCRSTPSARATRSITALSVSTSARVSPALTASPSRLCHLATRPSSMVGESASI